MQTMSKTKKLILSALLLTLSIILSRFLSIKTPLLAISFNFVPLMLAAFWLGPKYTVIISVLSDLIGAILFPFGEYFVGFTVTAGILGLIFGLSLYKKGEEYGNKELIVRLIIASVLGGILVNLLLNTLWLVIMYDKAFFAVLSTRIVKEVIMVPIQVIVMFALITALKPITKKYLFEEQETKEE